jgi:alcohol dehydrogenase
MSSITIDSLLAAYGQGKASHDVRHFAHAPGTTVVFGSGEVARVGVLARNLKAQRVLVVTDRGIAEAGHLDRVIESLASAGLEWQAFLGVVENPTTETVSACVESAHALGADLLIGLGGGSSMDTAKGCNFILTNGGEMKDYWGTGKATRDMLPMIAIPTTSGTGSECQSYALISDAVSHAKMACGDKRAAARIAILDPQLTLSQPPRVTRLTGIDAIAHALESAVCTKANAISRAYSRTAFALMARAFPEVMARPDSIEARAAMQLGSAMAGTAIENAMLGAAHSAANPLTAHFGTVHGEAVGVMLPHIIRHNLSAAREAYEELAATAGMTADGLADFVGALLQQAALPTMLDASRVTDAMIETLSREAAGQWTAQFNPTPVVAADFAQLYRAARGA